MANSRCPERSTLARRFALSTMASLAVALVVPSSLFAQRAPQPPGPGQAASARAPGRRGGRPNAARPAPGAGTEGTIAGEIAPAPTLADLESIVPRLSSANLDEVREAIDLLSIIDRPEVVPHLAALLRAGQPDAITDRTLEALGGLAQPSAIDVLTEFTQHRRASTRRRAYQALAAIEDPRVAALLERGLRDSDRLVRGTAATALGDIGARDSIDILFRAFERGVVEASVSIGKLGDARTVERFHEHLGRQAIAVMLDGYAQFVRRRDIADAVKQEIIGRLGNVAGLQVKQFLREYLATFGTITARARQGSSLIRAIEEAIRGIPDAPGGGRSATPQAAPAGGAQ